MKKVVIGQLFVQDNQERKFGADNQYYVVWVKLPFSEKEIPLIITEEEFAKLTARANNNAEDIPELGSEASINKFDSE